MNWNNLPNDIINYIMFLRKIKTCGFNAARKIQSIWKRYKIKVLIERFKILRHLKDFKIWNPTIQDFLLRSRL